VEGKVPFRKGVGRAVKVPTCCPLLTTSDAGLTPCTVADGSPAVCARWELFGACAELG
jgi:hypothetical protein